MVRFEPQEPSPQIVELIPCDVFQAIGPGQPNRNMNMRLSKLALADLFAPQPIVDHDMAQCCMAGIWLWNNFLDESHTISQSIETASGSYWHAIMHRREPDYANAKYWFRRVGDDHPVYAQLHSTAFGMANRPDLSSSAQFLKHQASWDPFAFTDLCQAIARQQAPDLPLFNEIAAAEWRLLFSYCYQRAVRSPN